MNLPLNPTFPLSPTPVSPLTTFTVFGLRKGNVRWGLAQMGTTPPKLAQVEGLRFFKLLGSGQGLVFSLRPDFGRYGMMAVWESEAAADTFFTHSEIFAEYRQRCAEVWTVKLLPVKTHGLWDGVNPFHPLYPAPSPDEPLAVLTRAAINWQSLLPFWRNAFRTRHSLEKAGGLIASIGVGELPFVRQATFSIWESARHMQQYAYQNPEHREVIQKTREGHWYKEELFARFRIVSSTGTWKGTNPLQTLAGIKEEGK
jgi:heme-degrading monooxygenase HmoA